MLLFFILLFLPFFADASCYTEGQAQAERLLRIHSELMVIGINCQQNGQGSYDRYNEFTAINADVIGHHEKIMQAYFLRQGVQRPDRAVHNFRTVLANTISTDAAQRPDAFCAQYEDRLNFALGLTSDQLEKWAKTYPVSKALCGQN